MNRRILDFDEPIVTWDEALPLGNGLIGALVWGEDTIKLSLDRADIWDTRPAPATLLPDFTYETMVNAYRNRDRDTIDRLFEAPYLLAVPTKLLAGRIELHPKSPVTAVRSLLDMKAAEARLCVSNGGVDTSVRAFDHAKDTVGYIRIENAKDWSVSVANPPYGLWAEGMDEAPDVVTFSENRNYGSLENVKYPPARYIREGELEGFIQATREEFHYAVLIARQARENMIDIMFTVAVSYDLSYDFAAEKQKLRDCMKKDYEMELAHHTSWWRAYHAESVITLPDETITKQYDIANYILGCVSRKGCLPMPLQGLFTADNGQLPPWKGDYHHDLNTEMCYISYLKANHLRAGECFLDFLTALEPQAKAYSASFFDAQEGLNLPSVMTPEGKPIGGWGMYSFSITNAAWLCHCFTEYYEYTLDEEFLKTRMYPFLKGVGLCVRRWIAESGDGYFELPNSSSPEINDNKFEACFDKNTNYDAALCRSLYGTLRDVCEMAGDGDSKSLWSGIFAKLRPLATGANGLKLNEDFELTESHRHLSHAMAIHPLRLIRYEGAGKDIIDKTIEHLKKLGVYFWTGYSVAWMAELFAIARNGEAAREYLRSFAENYCSPNGFHLNGDFCDRGLGYWTYRPFSLEGNMIAMDAVQEMLLYCEGGVMRVFPAIPKSWAKKGCSFENLRAKGALLVSSAIESGRVRYIRLKAERDVGVRLELPWGAEEKFNLCAGDELLLKEER